MEARATVIIPTFGQARFARWAVRSVQNQTVREIEICIICDGSPDFMVTFFQAMAQEDPRVQVFGFPKSPRTGEPYRDIVIRQTTGRIICYCSHDDLWLPRHVQEMERILKRHSFAHSLDAVVNLPEKARAGRLFERICLKDLSQRSTIKGMFAGNNCFGLTCGAHTRNSYFRLEEGWVTTPRKDVPTDLYMWCKFLAAFPRECRTLRKITALNFPYPPRRAWSEQERNDELQYYFGEMQDPGFGKMVSHSLCAGNVNRCLSAILPPPVGPFLLKSFRKVRRFAFPRRSVTKQDPQE